MRWMSIFVVVAALSAPMASGAAVEVNEEGFFVEGEYFFPVGVNYMPVNSAIRMYKDFAPEEIRAEFRALAALGLNTVRTFVYWEDLNPSPGVISDRNLDQIKTVLDIAGEEGLMVIPTLNTGHMSGGNWFPSWLAEGPDGEGVYQRERFRPPTIHIPRWFRDIFEDQLALSNAVLQAKAVAARLADHPALLYYDLGNEPQYWLRPRTPAIGLRYVELQVKAIKEIDPRHPVALGVGKFAEDTGFHSYGEHGINQAQDLYLVHTYPAGYYPQPISVIDSYVTYFAGFENRLSLVSGLPVQFQEFGLSDQYFAAVGSDRRRRLLAGYYRTSLWGSQLAGARAGVLAWMSNDYKRSLVVRDPYIARPYELDFGVLDQNLQPKVSGHALAEFAEVAFAIFEDGPLAPAGDQVAIILPADFQTYPSGKDQKGGQFLDTTKNRLRFLFSAYLTLRQLGINPVFATPPDDLTNFKLVVVSTLSPLGRELSDQFGDLADGGAMVYASGYYPACSGDNCSLSSEVLEITNARGPTTEGMANLRRLYGQLLGRAGVVPQVKSSDPFVETGLMGGRYLLAINHGEGDASTTLEFLEPIKLVNCFYGSQVKQPSPASLAIDLAGFGVEVCEIDLN